MNTSPKSILMMVLWLAVLGALVIAASKILGKAASKASAAY